MAHNFNEIEVIIYVLKLCWSYCTDYMNNNFTLFKNDLTVYIKCLLSYCTLHALVCLFLRDVTFIPNYSYILKFEIDNINSDAMTFGTNKTSDSCMLS